MASSVSQQERRSGPRSSGDARFDVIRRVTLVGAAVDLSLGVVKIVAGIVAHSHALVADGLHSLSDLGTDVLVLAAAKAGQADADDEHPYGHARIETAATVGLGLILIIVAAGIAFDSGLRLWEGENTVVPSVWAIGIAAASVLAKEVIYHYTMHHAKAIGSTLLEANAWHSRSDAASSLVVIVGLAGAMAGWPSLDVVAAIVVGVLIGKVGYGLCKDGLSELIDTGLDNEQLESIRSTIVGVDGVRDLHELRTRSMGGKALVDVHIMLDDPRISVSEGHQISETVRARLIRRIDAVEDVMVHIDPEDDELFPAGQNLALRGEIIRRLESLWAGLPVATYIERVDLHYLGGKIQVTVTVPAGAAGALSEDFSTIRMGLEQALHDEDDVGRVELMLRA